MRHPANPKGRSAAEDLRRRDYLSAKRPRGACEAGGDIIAPPMVTGAPRRSRSSRPSPGRGFGSKERGNSRIGLGATREKNGGRGTHDRSAKDVHTPMVWHFHPDLVDFRKGAEDRADAPSLREMRSAVLRSRRFGAFIQSSPTGSGNRRRNMIFHRTLPDCDPGDRSVAGAIFCIADIVEGGARFRAAFLPFPFARRCRLRQRRAKTKTPRRPAGTARQKCRSERQWAGDL